MKVRLDDHFGSTVESLINFVEFRLVGDSEMGLVEELERTQGNIVQLLSVLIDRLVESKILDAKDVKALLSTYEEFEIIEEVQ